MIVGESAGERRVERRERERKGSMDMYVYFLKRKFGTKCVCTKLNYFVN
jgi:hypothetical protein